MVKIASFNSNEGTYSIERLELILKDKLVWGFVDKNPSFSFKSNESKSASKSFLTTLVTLVLP